MSVFGKTCPEESYFFVKKVILDYSFVVGNNTDQLTLTALWLQPMRVVQDRVKFKLLVYENRIFEIFWMCYIIMTKAYVLINCDTGSEESVIDDLKSIIGVKNVSGVFGAYDIVAEVQTQTVDKLRETITMKIRKIAGVRSTLTLLTVDQ